MSWLSGKRCLVAIPTYDERENLPWVVAALRGVTESLPCAVDLLVVDDQSPDGTGELAEQLAQQDPALKVLHRRGPRGLGRAYLDAFRYALAHDYDLVVEIDADLSHDPARLPSLLAAAGCQRADVVRATVYLTDLGEFAAINEVYAAYFGEHRPARACVQVAALPKGAQVEIDFVAQLPA